MSQPKEPTPPSPSQQDTLRDSSTLADFTDSEPGAPSLPTQLPSHTTQPTDSGLVVAPTPEHRYDDLGQLGMGGLGEVRRARDQLLHRVVAKKQLRGTHDPRTVERFLHEARITAALAHPGIVPVFDAGQDAEGKWWFSMQEIQGRPLHDIIALVHRQDRVLRAEDEALTLSSLLDIFTRITEAVAYAHTHGVMHRDLKPHNIMVGDLGEVYVVDWGLAIPLRADGSSPYPGRGGTPAYMAPEQIETDRGPLGAWSDVYALGVLLHELLSGALPFHADDPVGYYAAHLHQPPPPLPASATAGPIPEALAKLVERCLHKEPHLRPPHAGVLLKSLQAWRDGSVAREQALALVERAKGLIPLVRDARSRAKAELAYAAKTLSAQEVTAPLTDKQRLWTLQDEAQELLAQGAAHEVRMLQLLRGALITSPGLPEAHAALAAHYAGQHRELEAEGRFTEAAAIEPWLREHDLAGQYAAYLLGTGTLSLHCDTPRARAELFELVEQHHLLKPRPSRDLGALPLQNIPLPRGRWLVMVRAPGHLPTLLPVTVRRQEQLDFIRPGATQPTPIALAKADALGPQDVLVPAGPVWLGGDPYIPSAPRSRIWVDAFVMRVHPVSNAEYLAFLNDLVRTGREAEALVHVPRERAGTADELGPMIFGRDPQGQFILQADAEGEPWEPNYPVVMVDFFGAYAYARWEAARSGLPWRLPVELEWEKAARGDDERSWPFGNHADRSWMCIRASHQGSPKPPPLDAFPDDQSVYGVRGLGGGVRDWCLDGGEKLQLRNGCVVIPSHEAVLASPEQPRAYRGGDWFGLEAHARSAYRAWNKPTTRNYSTGFRLARSYPG